MPSRNLSEPDIQQFFDGVDAERNQPLHALGRLAEASARKGRFVLVMHGIAPERDAHLPASVQPHLTAADMHAILIWLSARYTPLTPAEFLESAKPGVLLTFDDGFANNAEVLLPILEEFDAPAVFFISLQHVWEPKNWLPASREIARSYWQTEQNVPPEKAHAYFDGMSMSQLKLCAAHPLITIGSHTVSHPFLSRIDPKIAEYEVANSKEALEKLKILPICTNANLIIGDRLGEIVDVEILTTEGKSDITERRAEPYVYGFNLFLAPGH